MSYVHLARSSFNDEEMHQMLAQNPPFGERKLRKYFRSSRGLILSKDLSNSEVALACSRLDFSWREFSELASNLESDEVTEKRSSIKIPCAIGSEELEKAFGNLREARKRDENYVRALNPNSIDIKATYIKTDYSRSKAKQREKKTVQIGVSVENNVTEISFDSESRAALIVSQFLKEIRKASKTVVPSECAIIFIGAGKDETQTKFFLSLIRQIDGYKLISVSDVRVNRASVNPETESDDDADTKEEFKGLIKTALLRGDDVTSSKMFQQLMADRYFISGISWYAREVGGDEAKVELEAGFKEDANGIRFFADATRIFGRTAEKEDEKTAKRLNNFQRSSLQKKILKSAFTLFEEMSPPSDEE